MMINLFLWLFKELKMEDDDESCMSESEEMAERADFNNWKVILIICR